MAVPENSLHHGDASSFGRKTTLTKVDALSVHSLRHLAADMDVLATDTWYKLADGDQARIKFREDSITDHNLLALHRIHGSYLSVLRYNQREEAISGADWEWWIGSDADGWFVLRIQAKRAHGSKYPEIAHKSGSARQLQYQVLLDGCSAPNQYPFHLFYNGWERDRFRGDPTVPADAPWWSTSSSKVTSQWGCMAVATVDVRDLHTSVLQGKYYIPRYLRRGFPWSYLFSGFIGGTGGADLIDGIQFNAYRASRGAEGFRTGLEWEQAVADLFADTRRQGLIGRDTRTMRLPDYAEAARAQQFTDAVDPVRLRGTSTPKRVTVTDFGN